MYLKKAEGCSDWIPISKSHLLNETSKYHKEKDVLYTLQNKEIIATPFHFYKQIEFSETEIYQELLEQLKEKIANKNIQTNHLESYYHEHLENLSFIKMMYNKNMEQK